jgi:hypothetical protein
MLKVVEDVRVPISDKLQKLGRMEHDHIVKQRLIARFVNEQEAEEWLKIYNLETERRKAVEDMRKAVCKALSKNEWSDDDN